MVKGHAYGNDFLLAPESDVEGRDCAALARAVCSRHEGIGADGLLVYTFEPSSVRMRLYNADGSQSEVSGNGIRCLAALAVRERPGATSVTIDTPAGPKVLHLQHRDGDTLTFRAAMGTPQDIRSIELEAAGRAHPGGGVVWLEIRNVCCSRICCSNRDSMRSVRQSSTIRNSPIARTSRSRKLKRRTGSAS